MFLEVLNAFQSNLRLVDNVANNIAGGLNFFDH